ncbi:MAG UNVERIFIED_CONTAM: hypothetical protein LVR18_24700 [Planctomycetaceae bacterium]
MQITELQSLGFGTTELLPVGNGVEAGTSQIHSRPRIPRSRLPSSTSSPTRAGQTLPLPQFLCISIRSPARTQFQVLTAPEVTAAPGVASPLVADDGTAAIQISYNGPLSASAGVLLRWSFLSGSFSGLQFPGDFTTDTIRSDATFNPQSGGAAWIYGSVAGVNAILADLESLPKRSFPPPRRRHAERQLVAVLRHRRSISSPFMVRSASKSLSRTLPPGRG